VLACLLVNCDKWHAGFVLTTVEAIGDITATEEASALATFGDKHNRRVQGGLLGDGQYFAPAMDLHTMQLAGVSRPAAFYVGYKSILQQSLHC